MMAIGIYAFLVTCLHTCTLFISLLLLQLDSKSETELKEEDEEDYAMNSESYLEVRFFSLEAFQMIMLSHSLLPLIVSNHTDGFSFIYPYFCLHLIKIGVGRILLLMA